MVLCLKTWESRSLPGLQSAKCPLYATQKPLSRAALCVKPINRTPGTGAQSICRPPDHNNPGPSKDQALYNGLQMTVQIKKSSSSLSEPRQVTLTS